MRTIGVAEEAIAKMARRLQSRVAFGKKISEHSIWEQRIAAARIDIDMTRLLCLKAADMMDKVGNKAAALEIARQTYATGKLEASALEAKLAPMTSTGKIVAIVTGHKGKVAGVLLDDGTTASAGHKSDLGALGLKVGDQVTLTGRGGVYPRGKGMMIEQVKLPSGDSRTLAAAPRRHRDHAKI